MQPITAYPATLEDLVFCPRHHEHLPEQGVPLHVASLFQEVGPYSPGGLTEELGDVEDAEVGCRAEANGQLRAGYIQRSGLGNAQRLEIENGGGGISQSSPRAGTSFRSSRSGSCSPRHGWGRENHYDCM
jgi:hypothetical protein